MKAKLWWRLVGITALTLMIVLTMLIPWGAMGDGFQMRDMLTILKPGIDLNGGTRMIYHVSVEGNLSGGRTPAEVMIDVLKKRIDPQGTKNIVWRAVGDDQIEITIPRATVSAEKQRTEYNRLRHELFSRNISRRDLQAALGAATPEARREALMALAQDVPGRDAILAELADAYEAMQQARAEAVAANREPENFGKYLEAKIAYDRLVEGGKNPLDGGGTETVKGILETNVRELDVMSVLRIPPDERDKKGPDGAKSSQQRLLEAYPNYQDRIKETIAAYDAWKSEKEALDDPDDLKRMLKGTGILQFHLAVEPDKDPISAGEIEDYRNALLERSEEIVGQGRYRWFPLADTETGGGRMVVVEREATGQIYALLHITPEHSMTHPKAGSKEQDWKFIDAHRTSDESNLPAVGFQFDQVGGNKFFELTRRNVGRVLASVLDGEIVSAPNINSPIHDRGIITGRFTGQEASELARKLQAGALPGTLSEEPISEQRVEPSLGVEHRNAGLRATAFGLIAVAAFMLIYYLAPLGLAAVIAVTLNLIYLVGLMAGLGQVWTLPGIAGLILTVGMAVDANVLIYERIREEQDRGSPLRVAVKQGYAKALSTILDANVTTLITTIILYFVGTPEIKGFAIVLGIGVVSSVFTALVVTRVIMDLGLEYGWYKKKLHMLKLVGRPNIRWMKKRFIFWVISAVLLIAGFVEFFGKDAKALYDVELVGGTRVQVTLDEGADPTPVQLEQLIHNHPRQKDEAGNNLLNDASVRRVIQTAATTEQSRRRFEITTTMGPEEGETDQTATGPDAAEPSRDVRDMIVAILTNPGEMPEWGMGEKSLLPEKASITIADQAIWERWAEQRAPTALPTDQAFPIVEASMPREGLETIDLSDQVGGLGVIMEDIKPAVTLSELRNRIESKLSTSEFEMLAQSGWEVFGLNRAEGTAGDEPRFTRILYAVPASEESGYNPEPGKDNANWIQRFAAPQARLIYESLTDNEPLDSVNDFSPSVARDVKIRAMTAVILAMIAIVIYVWVRFGSWLFGLGAIVPLIHDVAVVVGLIAISKTLVEWVPGLADALMIQDFRFDVTVIAAILTVIGYSLNDTIVVFDRIRENRGRLKFVTPKIVDDSINQNISRTVLTSLTTFIAVFIMYVFGGQGIHGFTFALLIGLVIGTYSSIAVAGPLLLGWREALTRRDLNLNRS